MNQTRETELLLPITSQDNSETSVRPKRDSGLTKLLRSVGHTVTRFFSSGRLLNALSIVSGLRDPGKEGFWAAVFTTALVVTDFSYLAWFLLASFICPKIDYKGDWLCPYLNTTHVSITETQWNTNCFVLLMGYLAGISSHFVFLFCFLKLDEGENTIKPKDAPLINNRSFWLKTNVPLVLLGLAQATAFGFLFSQQSFVQIMWAGISQITAVWRSIVNCYLFGMIMMALNDCVNRCENEIKNLHSEEVNDAIVIHQHLCARVFSTSDTLKPWFIINWLTPVFFCVLYIGNISTVFDLSSYNFCGTVGYFFIGFFVLLYPCYSAASVTSKCRQILIDINMTKRDDWPPGHPFKQRGQLLQFIQYAEYTQCGFRVGKTVFGTNYAWISTLFVLLVGVVKFLYN